MDLITVDFETYYDKEYSLSKMTTEEYVRDPRFEVIGVGVKVNGEQTEWASGSHAELKKYLQGFSWDKAMFLAHNTMFDGAIAAWHFGIHPRAYTDTLCISRAVNGVESSASLKALAERYSLGVKGDAVVDAIGMHRADFSDAGLAKYGDYCVNDVNITYDLFRVMGKDFPRSEFKLIDLTLRMFIDPILDLDLGLLEQHLENIRERKDSLLRSSGVTKEELMSNQKFAALLEGFGVKAPTKISLTTGKETFAFAKNDEPFLALQEHEDDRVQALVSARLGTKSTLEETRTQRFIDIAKRGLLPVPVRYYAAHTSRWGGDDKINLQNLPTRGPNAKALKKSIVAPEGYSIIDADSAQIEARVLAWLAGQDDLVSAFTNGEDVYKKMASRIYGVDEDSVTKEQRFVGKTTILGAGYGMGAVKFKAQLQTFGTDMELEEARRVINIYRDANYKINELWRNAHRAIEDLSRSNHARFGRNHLITTVPNESGLLLPSGLLLRYGGLRASQTDKGFEYSYDTRRGRNRIYGGKVVENVCQALARCIIGEQMLEISKRYRVVLTVHDSIVCCVPDKEVPDAVAYVEQSMRTAPPWAEALPLNCEVEVGKSYGSTVPFSRN